MKKLIALSLTLVMMMTLFVGCAGSNETPTPSDDVSADVVVPASALEILENIWAAYGDEEKFPVMGGNPEAMNMEGPGVWDPAYAEGMQASLLIPADQMASVTEAASMIHMMNANTFTCGVVRLAEGTDAAAFAAAMQQAVQTNPWMCGFPEKLIIAVIGGEYVLTAFGVNDAMTPFEGKLTAAYADAEIAYNEAIAG